MSNVPKPAKDALKRFEVARSELQSFETEHREIIDNHKRLYAAAEDALDNCKKQYRVNYEVLGSSFGGFTATSKRTIDADALIGIVGIDTALELGLVENKYTINKPAYERAVSSGVLSADTAADVETTSIAITAPKL